MTRHRGEKRAGLPAPAGGVDRGRARHVVPGIVPQESRLVVLPVSSRTHEVGDIPGRRLPRSSRDLARPRRQADRVRTGGPFFLDGQAEGPHGAPRPSAHSRAWRGRPAAQPACDPGAPQSDSAKVWRCGSSMPCAVRCRWTRGATLARVAPFARFSSRTHDPLTRYFAATSAAFIPASAVEEAPALDRSIE